MNQRLLALWIFALLSSAPESARADVMASVSVLHNGLTVVIAPAHARGVATLGILYKCGSRDETPWTTGVAHQVEHMMFKGTTDLLKPGDIDRRFYDNNASTDQDATYYYESFRADELGDALAVEADRMVNAAFDANQLAAENVVVLAEMERADDDPAQRLDEQVIAAAMQAHQYHWPTIGWKNVVSTFATHRDLVYDFYLRHYAPQNAVLVITGDVDRDAALAQVHKYFDAVLERPIAASPAVVEPAQHGVRRVTLSGPAPADKLEMAYHVPGGYSDDAYVLRVLDGLLAGGQSSRLFQALEGEYASDISTAPNDAVDPFVYTVTVTLLQGVSADDARAVIERELTKVAQGKVSDAELRTAKKQVIAADTFEHDGIEQVAEKLARWQAWTGDWNNDARFAARIEAVTADQVRQAARRYLTRDNLTVGTFTASPRPSSGKVNALSLRGARVLGRSAYRRWAAAATAWGAQNGGIGASDLPARFTLPNGVVLVVGENHISASAVIEVDSAAGSEFDTPGSSGLAALTQDMLLHGTAAAPGEKWQDALDALGVNVDTWIHVADAGMSAQTLSADEPKAMALLADALQHSAFDADEFGLSKAQLIDDVRAGASDASNVAREALYRMLYPRSSPWAWPADGTVAGLEKVRRADALAFYRAHYAPNDTIIAVTGDVDPRAIQAQVVRLFGTWRRVRVAAGSGLAGPTLPAATRRANAVVPGTTQVDVWAGAPGVSARSDDYDAAQLMNFILGGGSLSSMMLHQAREVDGYVYNIGSRFSESTAGGGPWTMTFAADRADVDRVMAEAAEQMRSLQRAQLSEDELAQYRRLAADAVLTGELSNGGLADDLMEQELLGLGVDHSQQLRRIFDAVTPAQIQAAAQKYLEPDRLTISTAGPP